MREENVRVKSTDREFLFTYFPAAVEAVNDSGGAALAAVASLLRTSRLRTSRLLTARQPLQAG